MMNHWQHFINVSANVLSGLLPFEYQKCLVGLDAILRKTWDIANNTESPERDRLQAASLEMQAYAMKIDLLTNATVVDDAIRFVASYTSASTIEKANSVDRLTVNEEVRSSDDIQGSEEDCNHEQQSTAKQTTSNTIF
jgi:hypothetical protein